MKLDNFFAKLLAFQILLSILVFLGISELLIRKYIVPKDHMLKASKVFKESTSLNTIWGASSTLHGINNLENFVNLSRGSDNFQDVEIKLKHYYQKRDLRGKVILDLALNSLSNYRDKKVKSSIRTFFLTELPFSGMYLRSKYFQHRSSKYILNYFSNGFTINQTVDYVFNNDGSVSSSRIYTPVDASDDSENLNSEIGFGYLLYLPKEDLTQDPNQKALLRIISFLKNHDFEVCLLTAPWHTDLMSRYHPNTFQRVLSLYRDIAESNNYEYFNFSRLKINSNYFDDPGHLNSNGAKYFTNIVSNSCFKQVNHQPTTKTKILGAGI